MGCPHTTVTKGKCVVVRLRDGGKLVGKFVESKGRFVRLDTGTVTTAEIRSMTIKKGNGHGRGG